MLNFKPIIFLQPNIPHAAFICKDNLACSMSGFQQFTAVAGKKVMLPLKEKSQIGENEKEFKRKHTCFLVIFLLQNAKFASKICQKHWTVEIPWKI
jgi:hypothetical protein